MQQPVVPSYDDSYKNSSLFNFLPNGASRYLFEVGKQSKIGCVQGKTKGGESFLATDHNNGKPGGKVMGKEVIKFDEYKNNTYYFQFKIEVNYEDD